MTIQTIKQHILGRARCPQRALPRGARVNRKSQIVNLSLALALALAGGFVARTAFAKIANNTIDPVGIVAHNGRHVTLTGPIAITAGERVQMRVTVTQRTTGAVAEGHAVFFGTGTTNQWETDAAVQGRATFEPGPATAVAIARSNFRGQATDAHQWLVESTLVQE